MCCNALLPIGCAAAISKDSQPQLLISSRALVATAGVRLRTGFGNLYPFTILYGFSFHELSKIPASLTAVYNTQRRHANIFWCANFFLGGEEQICDPRSTSYKTWRNRLRWPDDLQRSAWWAARPHRQHNNFQTTFKDTFFSRAMYTSSALEVKT